MQGLLLMKVFVLTVAAGAAVMDIRSTRIKNGWILLFWLLGAIWQIWRVGWGGVLFFLCGAGFPLLLLFSLFHCRMLGAGDIKLFSVLGGFFGPWSILRVIFCSFLIGAVISCALLLSRGILPQRLKYFVSYLRMFSLTAFLNLNSAALPYRKEGFGPESIHFSIPIFLAVLLKTGGLY